MAALPNDESLVGALRARDEAAFAQLVRAWSPAMLRLARYHVGSRAVAEEVVQETWLAVVTQIGSFEGRSSVRTWVFRICANIGRRHGAREHRSVAVAGLEAGPTVAPERFRGPEDQWPGHWTAEGQPGEWGPEERIVTRESQQFLGAAVSSLPERQAHVVALRDIHGFNTAEVAELAGLSQANVRVLLHRGRAALRERLADYYAGELRAR